PLTPNGKVDRRALPAPEPARLEREPGVAPRTPTERLLADIWAALLLLPQIGIHDNFFANGGDSMLAIRMVARVHKAGFKLSPQHVFQRQTIAELAGLLGSAAGPQAQPEVLTGPMPLILSQRRFFQFHHPDPHHYNMASLVEVAQR